MSVLNWPVVLDHRRRALAAMVQAKKHATYAGDRATVERLRQEIVRQRERVNYAAKMARWEPRVFTFVRAPFAPADNRPDNAKRSGG